VRSETKDISPEGMDPAVFRFVKANTYPKPFPRSEDVPTEDESSSFSQLEKRNRPHALVQTKGAEWDVNDVPEKHQTIEGDAWRTYSTYHESPFGRMRTAFYA